MSKRLAVCLTGLMFAVLPASSENIVLRGTHLYTAPETPVIRDGVLVISDGKILAVGANGTVRVPTDAVESSCSGGVITAAFHNSHVHLTGEQFNNAGARPAAELAGALREMLTRYGFTTVTDAASQLDNTLALRARIASGEIPGPRILTAGLPLYPPQGVPFYLREMLSPAAVEQLPQPATAAAALAMVRANLGGSADAMKLFVATPQRNQPVKRMPVEIARVVTAESHRLGKLVMAHPTDVEGVRAAVAADVDIIVHTTLGGFGAWPKELVSDMIQRKVSVVPTLQLWPYELKKGQTSAAAQQRLIATTLAQLEGFSAAGGQVLFGTDVGYMTEFDPSSEYELMAQAGLTPMQILASLTTAPSARWNEATRRGRIVPGMDADIVVLAADPSVDARNFAKVRCTLRGGYTLFSQPK